MKKIGKILSSRIAGTCLDVLYVQQSDWWKQMKNFETKKKKVVQNQGNCEFHDRVTGLPASINLCGLIISYSCYSFHGHEYKPQGLQ